MDGATEAVGAPGRTTETGLIYHVYDRSGRGQLRESCPFKMMPNTFGQENVLLFVFPQSPPPPPASPSPSPKLGRHGANKYSINSF